MSVEVISPGIFTTIQDIGRKGYRQYGVSTSGAIDSCSLRMANILTGNEENAACLETVLAGLKLRFHRTTLLAICGADAKVCIDNQPVPMGRPVIAREGMILSVQSVSFGIRTYIAFAGGLDVPEVLQSRSTYVQGNLGGFEGRTLKKGDQLPLGVPSDWAVRLQELLLEKKRLTTSWGAYMPRMKNRDSAVVRVMRGCEYDWFTDEAKSRLWNNSYTISKDANRMGYRLEGAPLVREHTDDMLSDAVAEGVIQVPPDGNPIILLADCQTTGGYPRIGTVISVDLPLLGQMQPMKRINFSEVTIEEAQQLYIEQEKYFSCLKKMVLLQPL
jgi:antagonist of KipI